MCSPGASRRAGSASSSFMPFCGRRALGSLSETGGEVAQASGAAERLFEILAIRPAIASRRRIPYRCRSPARGEVAFDDVRFSYPTRPNVSALDGVSFRVARRRESRDRRTVRRRQEHDLSSAAALLRSDCRPHLARRRAARRSRSRGDLRGRIALVPQDSVMFAASVRDNIRFGRPGCVRRGSRARGRARARRRLHRRAACGI